METIEGEILAKSLCDSFQERQITYSDCSNIVQVKVSFNRDRRKQEFDMFVESIREFLFQYTTNWEIDTATHNNLEGYFSATLKPISVDKTSK